MNEDVRSPGRRTVAISEIAASIHRMEPRFFFVALVGYYLEGYAYPASGLSVDPGGISDMIVTDNGFSCQALFSPQQVRPEIVIAKGTVPKTVSGEVREFVPVRVDVKYEDIWAVLELIDGEQIELYKDFESMEPGMVRFHSVWTRQIDGADADKL